MERMELVLDYTALDGPDLRVYMFSPSGLDGSVFIWHVDQVKKDSEYRYSFYRRNEHGRMAQIGAVFPHVPCEIREAWP